MYVVRFLNEGNDIFFVLDLKRVLESNNGLKGIKICVIFIDNVEELKIKFKIFQISFLNNFRFDVDLVIVRRVYQIGCGCFIEINILKDQYFNVGEMNGFEVNVSYEN